MKKLLKKVTVSVVSLVMMLTLLPASAFATNTLTIEAEETETVFYKDSYWWYEFSIDPTDLTDISWSVVEGTLPEGFALAEDPEFEGVCLLEGEPTELISEPVALKIGVTAKDASGVSHTGTVDISLTVEEEMEEPELPGFEDVPLYATIEEADCEVPMATANTKEDILKWLNDTWLTSLEGYDEFLEETNAELLGMGEISFYVKETSAEDAEDEDAELLPSFVAAEAGDADNTEGIDGYLDFTVMCKTSVTDESVNVSLDVPFYTNKICTVKATAYVPPVEDEEPKPTPKPDTKPDASNKEETKSPLTSDNGISTILSMLLVVSAAAVIGCGCMAKKSVKE